MKRLIISLCTLLLFCPLASVRAQVISTIAGGFFSGYSGDGGPSTAARLYLPIAITTDTTGNIYFAEFSNHVIRRIGTDGIISTVAGTGIGGYSGDTVSATLSKLYFPNGLCLDDSGNIYISDGNNNRIRKVNHAGIITTVAGNGAATYSGDGGSAVLAGLYSPNGVAVDHAGNIYISDRGNHRIRKVNTLGQISTIAGNGVPGFTGDGGLASAAQVKDPSGMCFDNSGNLLFADKGASCIRKISTSGIITTICGNNSPGFSGDGGLASAALLDSVTDVKVDAYNNIYIADDNNNRIRKINALGYISTIAGDGTGSFLGDGGLPTAAELWSPNGVAIARSGRIYVADFNNNRVRMITPVDSLPVFTGGQLQHTSKCTGSAAISLDSLLTVLDKDTSQVETWTVIDSPMHGAVTGSYVTTSTGGYLHVSGYTYQSLTGYSGPDTVRIAVNDGLNADTTTIVVTVQPLPATGTITGPASVCLDGTATLADAIGGGAWHTSNANISISATGVVSGVTTGTDTIYYTVTSAGCTDSAHAVLFAGPLFNTPFTGPVSLCAGQAAIIIAPADTGTWTMPTGGILSVTPMGDSARITALSPGTQIITYTATNVCGTGYAYDTLHVIALPVLTSPLDAGSSCSGAAFSYTPSSAVSGASYTWDRAAIAGIANAAHSGSGSINESLTDTTQLPVIVQYVIVSAHSGCADTQTVSVTVNPLPVLIDSMADTVCSGQAINFVPVSSIPGSTFAWSRSFQSGIMPATGSGAGNIEESLSNTTGGFAQVHYVYTITASGCANTQALSLVLTPGATPPSITTHSPSVVCSNTLYQNFGFSPVVSGAAYTWSVGAGATIFATGAGSQYCLVNFNNPGLTWVRVTEVLPGMGCTSRDSFAVYAGSTSASSPEVIYSFSSGVFTCLESAEYTYQWGYDDATTLDSTILSGETNQAYLNNAPDFAHKRYWVMTQHDMCMQKTYYNTPLGVADVAVSGSISVAPDPTSGAFGVRVQTGNPQEATVVISDIAGRVLKVQQIMTDTDAEMSLDAPPGIYFLKATTSGGSYTSRLTIR